MIKKLRNLVKHCEFCKIFLKNDNKYYSQKELFYTFAAYCN